MLNQVETGQLTGRGAAEVLGLSVRHVRRILAAYRKEGALQYWRTVIEEEGLITR